MPTYDYKCKCGYSFVDIKGIRAYSADPSSVCPSCAAECLADDRDFSKIKIAVTGASVQNAEFNPGLGCVVKNKQHRSELAKRKGFVEVGNDFTSGQRMQNEFEKKKKEEIETNWNKEPSSYTI